MFLTFGILYPLIQREFSWKDTILRGITFVILVEILQPIFSKGLVLMILF